jgi:hypothetical protein
MIEDESACGRTRADEYGRWPPGGGRLRALMTRNKAGIHSKLVFNRNYATLLSQPNVDLTSREPLTRVI